MRRIRILFVGKVKTPHWVQAITHYTQRLRHGVQLEMVSVKDANASCSIPERISQESDRLAAQIRPQDTVICLDASGSQHTSEDFAALITKLWDTGRTPCFIVGGAYGLGEPLKLQNRCISLSKMTLPHELAQVVLFEQLYRVTAILGNTGYHH